MSPGSINKCVLCALGWVGQPVQGVPRVAGGSGLGMNPAAPCRQGPFSLGVSLHQALGTPCNGGLQKQLTQGQVLGPRPALPRNGT